MSNFKPLTKRCPHCNRLLHRHPQGFWWCSTELRDRETGEVLGCGYSEKPAGYRLFATREGRLQERATRLEAPTEEAAKAEAAAIVDRREEDGTWPEGCDAVLMGPAPDVRCWMYADEWDEITDQFEEPTNG